MPADMPEGLRVLVERVEDVSPLPVVVGQLMAVSSDPLAGARNIAGVIGRDVALAAKVVRTANSAFYGGGREILDIPGAVVRLGMGAIRNIVVGMNVAKLYRGREEAEGGFGRAELWRHSVAVSLLSDLLARHSGIQGSAELAGEAFLAGLLHDIGVVLEDEHGRGLAEEMPWVTRKDDEPLSRAEKEAFGFDHQALGAAILKKWKFPESLCQAAAFHHRPSASMHNLLLQVVALAEMIVADKGLGYCDVPPPSETLLESRLRSLKLDHYQAYTLAAEVETKLPAALQVFAGP